MATAPKASASTRLTGAGFSRKCASAGSSLSEAYYRALLFTGKVVMLTGVTLGIGVVTWVASPIKFQADMGLLLAFMFLWNMLGALLLLPALAHFLLKPAPVSRVEAEAFGAVATRA